MNAKPDVSAKPWPTTLADLQESIRRRAEEIYIRKGRIPGSDLDNWAEAEAEIHREAAERRTRRTAVIVTVNGIQYVGEYALEACEGYTPGEFAKGEAVPIRFDGDKMFLKRPDGRELKTTLVKKVG